MNMGNAGFAFFLDAVPAPLAAALPGIWEVFTTYIAALLQKICSKAAFRDDK